ncbi:hypothetical protein ACWGIU_00695 [Streptomyces sp. NPDC054840]
MPEGEETVDGIGWHALVVHGGPAVEYVGAHARTLEGRPSARRARSLPVIAGRSAAEEVPVGVRLRRNDDAEHH